MVAEIAAEINGAVPPDGSRAAVASSEPCDIPGATGVMHCRVYEPTARSGDGIVVLVHGGAWIAGSVPYHDGMARALCATSGAPVVSVEYTPAPQAMFPQQLDEVRAAIDWVARHGTDAAGPPPKRLALCGDSAGGNMAAVIAREWGTARPPIALVALVNPVVDCTASLVKDPETLGFSTLVLKAYVPEGVDASDPRLSPLLHAVPSGHPATFIAIGVNDHWRPEQEAYAAKLKDAGVPVEVIHSETGHLGPDGAHATPSAMPTLTAAGAAIRRAFASR